MEMVVNLATNAGLFWAMLPEIVLAVWALALMLVTGWRHHGEEDQRLAGHLALAALVSSLFALWWLWAKDARPDGIAQMVTLDGFRYASSTIFLLGAIMAVMLSLGYVGRERILTPEYYLLILFATIGMMVMSAAADLIVLFIGIRHCPHLWRDRHDQPHRHRCPNHEPCPAIQRHAHGGHRPVGHRLCLQGCGRAVPHVDAGRLRRRTNPGDRVHGRRGEGRGVCGTDAHYGARPW
jgi:hypothetical protein